MRTYFLFFALLCSLSVSLRSETNFVRGSAAVLDASSGLKLSVIGQEQPLADLLELPRYIPGLFSATTDEGDSLFAKTSNDVSLFFEGPGFFGVERFESAISEASFRDGNIQEEMSRMILNLRRGLLVIDSRALDEESQFLVELPFGRISGTRAVWYVQVDFDHRSGIYDFTVACDEGFIRLSDLTGESYLIYAGQRLAGAGSYVAPAIEVGEHTDQSRQRFKEFAALQAKREALALDRSAMLEQMAVSHSEALTVRSEGVEIKNSGRRPVVIELAPSAPRLTPFRGEVRLPRGLEEIGY